MMKKVCDPQLEDDDQKCLSKYFLNKEKPRGLWDAVNHQSLCFKCQTLKGNLSGQDYFATVFDGDDGIAILSTYIVTAEDAYKIPDETERKDDWQETPGKLGWPMTHHRPMSFYE